MRPTPSKLTELIEMCNTRSTSFGFREAELVLFKQYNIVCIMCQVNSLPDYALKRYRVALRKTVAELGVLQPFIDYRAFCEHTQ